VECEAWGKGGVVLEVAERGGQADGYGASWKRWQSLWHRAAGEAEVEAERLVDVLSPHGVLWLEENGVDGGMRRGLECSPMYALWFIVYLKGSLEWD
jgi:hypothetical protein